ncbi:MAG: rubrerythrin family protein [Candidatus Firestonebacteria bacterium]|nr:rubrerythrin family protein [Candidatus Firestonebacteria bacterium]
MKKRVLIVTAGLALSCLFPWAVQAAVTTTAQTAITAPAVQVGTSLQNLTTTFNGESHAQAKYLAFAKKAQSEGYLKIAKLFRAAAMSEGIQAQHHAAAVKAMGGIAKASPETPRVGSTRENLETALKSETYEIATLYPAYIQKAETEKNLKALQAFGGAKTIEAVHVKLFAAALSNLEAWKATGDLYVCRVCGNVVEKLDFEYCPICKEPISEFVKIQ